MMDEPLCFGKINGYRILIQKNSQEHFPSPKNEDISVRDF
jgi:hypothetical protein